MLPNYNLFKIGAISHSCVLERIAYIWVTVEIVCNNNHFITSFDLIDFERFRDYLEEALQKMKEPEKSFVVMDNASYHSKLVRLLEISVANFT